MADRYGDRYDSYDSYDSYDDDGSYGSYGSRGSYDDGSAGRSSGRYADRLSSSSASRSSDRSSARSSHARIASSADASRGYYAEGDDIDRYRRSSYTSSSSRSSSRRSSQSDAYGSGSAGRYSSTERTSRRPSHTSPTPRASSSRYADRAEFGDYTDRADRGQRTSASSRASYRSSAEAASSTRRSAYNRGDRSGYGSRRGGTDASGGGYGSRDDYASSYSDREPAPKRSNFKRPLVIIGIVALVVVLVGAIGAFAYVNKLSSNLHEGVDENLKNALVETDMAKEPFYMLLLGTDESQWRRENQADMADTQRSDSMMLARIDPVNKKVALISIHRDTMVDLGQYGEQKINAAYQYGGAAGAVEAVSKMAGVPISHYASVDFDGFAEIVDTIGGVEVNVPIDIDDPDAGGSLSAGVQTLNGDQALILCRSRHSYDDVASDGDVMRAANQRMVLSAIAKKILASDILTIANTVQVLSQYVTTDLEVTDIIGLAQIMQGINPDTDIYTAMEPTTSAYIDDTWYEYLDEDAWKEMIKRMDQGLPPVNKTEIDDATGTILSTGGADAPVV